MTEHKAKESDKGVAQLLRSVRLTCDHIEETKHTHAMLLENRIFFYNYKPGQDQKNLDYAQELQAMHRTYEVADNPVGTSTNTGLKNVIAKLHEQHKEIKITTLLINQMCKNGVMAKLQVSSSF